MKHEKEILLKVNLTEYTYKHVNHDPNYVHNPKWVYFYVDGTLKYENGYWDYPSKKDEYHQWAIVDNYVMFRKPDLGTRTGWQPYHHTGEVELIHKLTMLLNEAAMEKEFELVLKE